MALGLALAMPYGRAGDSLEAAVKALFASGEKGVMFDLSSASNLYTDSARATPVTASGQAIGSVTDLSPNAKHGSSAGTARPTWNSAGYGTFDAFDDYLQTASIDFSGTDAVTVVVAMRKNSDASVAVVCELGSTFSTASFSLFAPLSTANKGFSFGSRGSALSGNASSASTPGPVTVVATGEGDISSDQSNLRLNGSQSASAATDQGAGNYAAGALNIGARNGGASLYLDGRIYRLLVIGRALTTTERSLAERWAALPAGVTLA